MRQRRRLRPRRSAPTTPCKASPDARPACSTDATSAMTRIPGCSVSREGTAIGAKLGMTLPARQRHFEPDAEESPDLRERAHEHRRTDQQPEAGAVGIPETQPQLAFCRAPRGTHAKGWRRAEGAC